MKRKMTSILAGLGLSLAALMVAGAVVPFGGVDQYRVPIAAASSRLLLVGDPSRSRGLDIAKINTQVADAANVVQNVEVDAGHLVQEVEDDVGL